MADILITNRINKGFKRTMNNVMPDELEEGDMSFENFTEAVKWLFPDDSINQVALAGGEPLLHPQFDDFVRFLRYKHKGNTVVVIKTDGFLIDEHIDSLNKLNALIAVNLHSPNEIGEKKYKRIEENIKLLRLNGIVTEVMLDLTDKDMDYQFAIDLIKKYSLKLFRINLVIKSESMKNQMEYFREIENLFFEIAYNAAKEGCSVYKNCLNIPECLNLKHLGEAAKLEERYRVEFSLVSNSICDPQLVVTPSLHVARCAAATQKGMMLPYNAFRGPSDMIRCYKVFLDSIATIYTGDSICNGCHVNGSGMCFGGCMGPKVSDVLDIQRKIKEGFAPANNISITI